MEMREKIARALAPLAWAALGTGDTLSQKNRRTASLRHADAVLTAIGETHVLVPRGDLEQIVDIANRNEQSPEGDRLDALLSASAAKEGE